MTDVNVSVVILTIDAWEMTLNCIRNLKKNSGGVVNFPQIILIDNGSSAQVPDSLRLELGPNDVVVRLDTNTGYGEGNNIGVEAADGEIVILLNNDVMVEDGWIAPLLDVLNNDDGVGIAGPLFLNENGTVQEAGGFISSEAQGIRRGSGLSIEQADKNGYLTDADVDYVSGATLAIRKKDFLEVLGFEYIYEPAYYEDTDLCFKLRKQLGKRVIYTPLSRVVHLDHKTTSRPEFVNEMRQSVGKNKTLFRDRWLQD
jgi:O-antigen biosynthesis protein